MYSTSCLISCGVSGVVYDSPGHFTGDKLVLHEGHEQRKNLSGMPLEEGHAALNKLFFMVGIYSARFLRLFRFQHVSIHHHARTHHAAIHHHSRSRHAASHSAT